MRKISRKTAVLSMGLLFILPVLFYFQNAQAIWIVPEQITDNYIVRDDTQITVAFDGKGYIHFASVLDDAGAPENYIYYGNNSKPGYTDSDFLEAEGDKEELCNREEDGLNLTQVARPSISATDEGTPVIGFDANVVEFGHREAFASVVETKSGEIRRHQLSYENQYLYQSAPYTDFNQIARVGTNIIASRNGSYPYYMSLSDQSTLNPGNQTRLNFIGSPKQIVYNGSLLFVAAGKTLFIYSAPSLTSIGAQLSYKAFEDDIDALYYRNDTYILFLTVNDRIYAVNVFNPANPYIEASESFDVEGMFSIIGKGNYLYIACGITGLKTIRYLDHEFASTMTRPCPNPGKKINDVVFGNSNNLHIAADDALYTSVLTNPQEPSGLTVKDNTNIVSPIISIAYNSTSNNLALAMKGSTTILFYLGYEGANIQYTYVAAQPSTDLAIDAKYIYAAETSAGFLKLDISNPLSPGPSTVAMQNCTQITNYGTYAIASDIATDISVVNYYSMTIVSNKNTSSGGGPMFVDNNYIYINDQRYGLVIADANDIANVKLTAIKNLSGPMYGDIFVHNRIVYIAGEYGYADLAVIDASNFGSISTPIYYNFTGVTLKDVMVINNGTQTWGYATDFSNAAMVYFNLTNNLLIPSYNTTLTGIITAPTKMTYADKKIFICGLNGVQTVGISNMAVPSNDGINTVVGGGIYYNEIEIEDGVIFVGDGTANVRYYDLMTPTTIRTETASSAVKDFLIFDCAIFAATQTSGIGVFDVSKHDGAATTGDSYVSVAHFSNGTAVAIWIDGSSNLYYRKIYPNNIKSQIRLIANIPGILTPRIKITEVGNDSFIHIVYANTDNGIYYRNAKNGFSFSTLTIVAADGNARTKPRISAEKSFVGLVWQYAPNTDIICAISSNNGTSFTNYPVTSGTQLEYAPDLYVTWDGKCEVVYHKQMTTSEFSVFSRNNVDGTFDEECLLMDYQPGVTNFTNPRIAQKLGTVVIFYQVNRFEGSVWWAAEINVLGYQILNYDMDGNYNTLTIRDDPVGNWLFSGFRIGFNTTTLNSIKLNFTIVDNDTVAPNATYPTWSNVTTIPGNGSQYSEFYFYSPGNYFITHNIFTLYVWNASDLSTYLLKIPLDSFQLQSAQIYNVTTPGSNGTYLNYSLAIYPIFEYDNNLILDTNGLENEDNPYYGNFGLPNVEQPNFKPNFVDLKYFLLEENRRYNFYIYNNTMANATSGHFRLRLYNSSTILTAKDAPYITIDSQNLTTSEFRCPMGLGGTYGALIEPAFASDYGRIMEYKFYFSAVPLPTSLIAPRNKTFISHTDNNTNNIQAVELNWGFNIRDSDVVKFQIEIYTNISLPLYSLVYNKTVYGIGTVKHIFNASDQTGYYWRVRAVDDSSPENLGDWGPLGIFYYDPTPPEAPDVYALPWDTSVNYVPMTWNASYDGPYIVPRYYIYIANRPVFKEGLKPEDKYLYDSSGVTTLGVVLKNLRNYHYYMVVIAEDNVGQRSNASNVVQINVAIGGYISAVGKEFGVQVGDTFLYEITYVESDNKDVNQQPTMEYFYHRYPVNAQFHFWVQYFDTSQVYPVLATFYSRNQYEWDHDWFLVDDQIPITIFALAKDETYQRDVFALYIKANIQDKIVGNQTYDTLWRRGTDVLNVRVYTFYGELDGDGKQTSISFFVEKTSGVVCEMIYYDRSQNYGYSIQLIETSITMTHNDWRYSPLYLILALAAIGAIISGIIKKVEF